MTSEERVFTTLAHREPDKVPLDFGATIVTGIHEKAYRSLLTYLGCNMEPQMLFERAGAAKIHDELLERFHVDIRGYYPNTQQPAYWAKKRWEDAKFLYVEDEFGIQWRKPKNGGLYYDSCFHPFQEAEAEDLEAAFGKHPWPDLASEEKFCGLEGFLEQCGSIGSAVFIESPLVSIFDLPFRLRGYEDFYIDLAVNQREAGLLMDRLLELLIEFWRRAFAIIGKRRVIARTSDDLGSQTSLLISPETYRTLVKPRQKRLIDAIRGFAQEEVCIFFHCDGEVTELIPDFIETGIDILNPIQYSIPQLDPATLKREYGRDLTFWGGGIDTQSILHKATPQQVREEVKKQMDILKKGGGFIFSTVHNIQGGTPPENIVALFEAFEENRVY